jgi:ABC-2 type transport system permease protein
MLFGYLVPVVFTAYLPTLALLDLPGPSGLPAWLAWLTPVAAAWVWLLAFALWRWGTAHYQGGGG